MTWHSALQKLIDEFAEIDDQMERLEMLYELAEEVEELPTSQWNDITRVKGCQSEAHLIVEIDDTVHLMGAADAKLVQGLMGILTIAVNDRSPEEVLDLSPEFAAEMKILNTLTPSRSNGFRNMFDRIQSDIKELIK